LPSLSEQEWEKLQDYVHLLPLSLVMNIIDQLIAVADKPTIL